MKKFLKALWEALTTYYPDDEEPLDYYRASNPKEKADNWCPFCGYNGTADELRCHLLNHHSK